ncbi:MAG TPA: GNAT family N-acetyltransferase [Caulobacteraceae bacterium]|jgi:GNAT superfamily N-acetyltransferase|nr:GNAT family N-acetyltransferase [Caulobacteraceae bacterium]
MVRVTEQLSIARAADPGAVAQTIAALLTRFNRESVGEETHEPFALTVSAPGAAEILGGLWAFSLSGSFYVNIVIVPEASRGQGLGAELMRQAEQEARARGCGHVWLDTFAFQARLLRASRLRGLRPPGRPRALLSALLHAKEPGRGRPLTRHPPLEPKAECGGSMNT